MLPTDGNERVARREDVSAQLNVGNVVELRPLPVLIMDKPVYELPLIRRKLKVVIDEEYTGKCSGGVCILAWKPHKPAA